MKKICSMVVILIAVTITLNAQTYNLDDFYYEYKHNATTNISVPGWIVKLGVGIAKVDADEEERLALDFAKKIKKVKIMIGEDHPMSREDYNRFATALNNDGFEDLMQVKSKEENVNVSIREKNDLIRNVVVLVREESEFVVVNIKTKLTIDELSDFIHAVMEEDLVGSL